jgi:hypothetical protein
LLNNSPSARSEEPGRLRHSLMDLLTVLSRVIPASCFAIVCVGFWKSFIQTGNLISLIIKEDGDLQCLPQTRPMSYDPAYFCQPYLGRIGTP